MGALMKWLNSQSPDPSDHPERPLNSIDELRQRSLEILADCTRPHDERIRGQVARAVTAQQLWQVRCDMYQAIAHRHCEAEAVRRLNELLPAFQGWLPPGALRPL
jgi:hypothetical protein